MEMKMRNRLHGNDVNRPTSGHGHKYGKYKSASVWWCLYMLSNT